MKVIYDEGLEPNQQGKLVRSFYEEPQLIDTGLSHVPGLEDNMR